MGETLVAEMLTNLATNPSFETASGTVEVARNLAVNPSFEAVSGTVEARRNQFPVPRPAAGNATFANMTASTGTADGPSVAPTQYWRGTASAVTSSTGVDTTANATTTAAGTKTLSAWVRSSLAHSVNLGAIGAGAAGVTTVSQPTVVLAANTWTRVSFTGTFTATGLVGLRVRNVGAVSMPIGGTFDIGAVMVEDGPALLPFFDGVASPDTDLTAAWTGAVNNSASVLNGVGVDNTTNPGPSVARAFSSTGWASAGSKSLRIVPIAESANTSMFVAGSSSALTGLGVTFVAGQTYTVMAKCRLLAAQTGTLDGSARKIRVTYDGTGGSNFFSAAAPNAAGVTTLSITFTVPADATNCRVHLYNGALQGNGDVWWDDLLIVQGAYAGPYFDGSTRPKIRRNLCVNPSFETNLDRWSTFAGVGSRVTSGGYSGAAFYRSTMSATSVAAPNDIAGSGTTTTQAQATLDAGVTYTGSIYVRPSIPITLRAVLNLRNASNGLVLQALGADTVCPAGVWTRLSHTVTAPANTTNGGVRVGVGSAGLVCSIGDTIDMDACLIEASATPLDYFDGSIAPVGPYASAWDGTANASPSHTYDADLTNSWTGAANASASILTGVGVASMAGTPKAASYRSTQWSLTGAASIVVDNRHASGVSYAEFALSSVYPGGLAAMLGKTFTVIATMRTTGAVSHPTINNARSLVARFVGSATTLVASSLPRHQ